MPWKLDSPEYGTIEEWDNWKHEQQTNHPIKYFIQHTIPNWFTVHVNMRVTDWKWAILHRIHPKHRYHIVNTGLKPGYYDPIERILYVVMNELKRFYEYSHDRYGWNATPEHQEMFDIMTEVYNWWINDYPNMDTHDVNGDKLPELPDLPEEWGVMSIINSKYKDEPIMIKWREISKIHNQNGEEWSKKIEEMLHKVIKIRYGMWFT